jgi:hypothetical protein
MATQRLRHLPTVIIVGAQKAGTTHLYAYLIKHPRVMQGVKKEVDYFSKQPERSVQWYRSRFPLALRVWRRRSQVLEASPSYLAMPSALRQMKNVVPSARIVVLLRDPVSRAFSHYQHRKTRHLETRSFADAIDDELRNNTIPPRLGWALDPAAAPMLDYVSRGYYALQLELLVKLYARNRVLVIDSTSLFADTNAVCDRVFNYLGLESFEIETTKVFNRGYYKEKIDPQVAARLREHYRPYDEMLCEVLGRPCSWMTAPQAKAA